MDIHTMNYNNYIKEIKALNKVSISGLLLHPQGLQRKFSIFSPSFILYLFTCSRYPQIN